MLPVPQGEKWKLRKPLAVKVLCFRPIGIGMPGACRSIVGQRCAKSPPRLRFHWKFDNSVETMSSKCDYGRRQREFFHRSLQCVRSPTERLLSMKFHSKLRAAGVALVAVALGTALVACSPGSEEPASTVEVAANVNGTVIDEQVITDYIQNFRVYTGLEDDEDWGQWMATNGYTPETVREEVITSFADPIILTQGAKELGIELTQEEVDDELAYAKESLGDDYEAYLEDQGLTEEQFIENVIRPNLLQQKVAEELNENDAPSDEDVLIFLNERLANLEGSRRSSNILFDSSEAALAQQVLDQINSGQISFEDAAARYSIDEVSAQVGGDVSYDCLSTFVDEYAQALSNLNEGEVSGLVESDYGIHIIKCTDVLEVPADGYTSLDEVPVDIVEFSRNALTNNDLSEAFYAWFTEYQEGVEVEITDMPEGLPYDVEVPETSTQSTTIYPSTGTTSGGASSASGTSSAQ